jgi:hypothetical protein
MNIVAYIVTIYIYTHVYINIYIKIHPLDIPGYPLKAFNSLVYHLGNPPRLAGEASIWFEAGIPAGNLPAMFDDTGG